MYKNPIFPKIPKPKTHLTQQTKKIEDKTLAPRGYHHGPVCIK